jgi:STE24 endopeptidase
VNEDKSTRYHRRRRRADAAGTALVGVFLLALSASGAAGLFRTAAEWVASWLPWPLPPSAAVAIFAIGLAIAVHAMELPFTWYQGYWLERRYGLSTQILPHWLADHVKAAVASCGVMVAGLSAVYLSMRWAPSYWWAVSAALFVVAMVGLARLAPVVLMPIFYRVRPLDRPELTERLLRLAGRAERRAGRHRALAPDPRLRHHARRLFG